MLSKFDLNDEGDLNKNRGGLGTHLVWMKCGVKLPRRAGELSDLQPGSSSFLNLTAVV